jgi:pyruvate, orthophosphate dikinase
MAIIFRVGLSYVSCSPFRVPLARLAGAQAVINNSGKNIKGGESEKTKPTTAKVKGSKKPAKARGKKKMAVTSAKKKPAAKKKTAKKTGAKKKPAAKKSVVL